MNWKSWYSYSLAVFCLMVFLYNTIVFSGTEIRGSDHYWYLSATESLIKGEGVKSNNFFPSQALEHHYNDRKGFVHNRPQVYVAALFGSFFGPYHGWIVFNSLSYLFALFLYSLILRKLFPTKSSFLFMSLALVFPIALWVIPQPLSEPFLTVILALTLFVYYQFSNKFITLKFLAISLLSILLVLSHKNFILLFLVVPIVYYLNSNKKYSSYIFTIIFFLLPFFLHQYIKNYFPGLGKGSIMQVLQFFAPGSSPPMLSFFAQPMEQVAFSELILILLKKTLWAFKTQFFQFNMQFLLFYIPFNIMSAVNVFTFIKYRKSGQRETTSAFLITLFILFLHLLTASAFQNQFRYLVPYYPLLFFVLIYQISNLTPLKSSKYLSNHWQVFFYFSFILSAVLVVFLMLAFHSKAEKFGRSNTIVLLVTHFLQEVFFIVVSTIATIKFI
jgi:hypothetical protein